MPDPLMEFAQFAHPQRWWLRRFPPPWLDDPRWWVRAFRVSLMLGLMGTATGWLTVGGLFLAGAIDRLTAGIGSLVDGGALGILCGPGFWFGLGVLIPLSRWLGRGWVMSLLAVPASMFACDCGVVTFLAVDPVVGKFSRTWIPWAEHTAGFYAGFVGAAIVSIWMSHPLRKNAWLAGLAAAFRPRSVAGYCSCPMSVRRPLPVALAVHRPDLIAGDEVTRLPFGNVFALTSNDTGQFQLIVQLRRIQRPG